MKPRVSVILPTRNRLKKLQRALSSIDQQTFRDFEMIVVDDGSEDATVSWLQTNCRDAQVLAMKKLAGAACARNRGLEVARGEFIAFLDDDDFWKPDYLQRQIDHLDTHPYATLSYTDHVEKDPAGNSFRPDTQPLFSYPNSFVRLLAESFIHTLSVVVCRRKAFDCFGRFDESLDIVHDLDWYRRVLAGGGDFISLPLPLVERSVPGGLVTAYRKWFEEERVAHLQAFAAFPLGLRYEHMIRSYRSLFFARVGFVERDFRFAISRLIGGILESPSWATRIAALRLLRRIRFDRQVAP